MVKEGKLLKQLYGLAFILFFGAILLYVAAQFLIVFVGALILFTLFNPLYRYLTVKRGDSKSLAALVLIFMSFIIVLVPLTIVSSLIVQELSVVVGDREEIRALIETEIGVLDGQFPQLGIAQGIEQFFEGVSSFVSNMIQPLVEGVTSFVINLIMMYFLLYFMFTQKEQWKKKFYEFLPFSKKNKDKVVREFANTTNATIISSGVIAVVQGTLVTLSFLAVGLGGAFLWGFIAAILSFLPVIGTPIIWIPAVIYLFLQGSYIAATGLLIFSMIITMNVDNVLRPLINKGVGNIHPLTSFLGVFFGLYMFGFIGIILGPLLISYFFLFTEIYREEFL